MNERAQVKTGRRVGLVAAAAVAGAVSLGMSGCVGYNVYPPMEGQRGFTNVNSDPFPPVITESLKWTILRYPPNSHAEWNQPAAGNVGVTAYAVNLPVGMWGRGPSQWCRGTRSCRRTTSCGSR
jgi:hypothetical protein